MWRRSVSATLLTRLLCIFAAIISLPSQISLRRLKIYTMDMKDRIWSLCPALWRHNWMDIRVRHYSRSLRSGQSSQHARMTCGCQFHWWFAIEIQWKIWFWKKWCAVVIWHMATMDLLDMNINCNCNLKPNVCHDNSCLLLISSIYTKLRMCWKFQSPKW